MAKKKVRQPKQRIYCDSCFFIAIFNNEADRCGTCKQIIEDAQLGRIQIVTSTLAMAECVAPPSETPKVATYDEWEDPVAKFFDHKYIDLVLVDTTIAYFARQLQMSIELALKPPDAVHLSTAMAESADMLFTYDDKLLRLNGHEKLSTLTICKPYRPWDEQLTMAGIEHDVNAEMQTDDEEIEEGSYDEDDIDE